MKLSRAIADHNAWFFSTQDAYYSWFMSEENEGVKKFIESSSAPLHDKYIIDNGDYSFLLADIDGKVERLTPAFELTEESVHLDDDLKIMSRIININGGHELIRYIPANSSYEYWLIEDNDDCKINTILLDVLDNTFSDFLSKAYSLVRPEEIKDISKEIFNKKLLENIAEKVLPYNYMVSFEKEAERYGGIKEACKFLCKALLPPVSEYALNKTKEDVMRMLQNEELEPGI